MHDTLVAVKLWLHDTLAASYKSERTIENYVWAVEKLWRFFESTHLPHALDEIKPTHLRQFFVQTKLSKSSLVSLDRSLRAVFSRIEREGREDFGLADNWQSPLRKVERISLKGIPKRVPLTQQQAQLLMQSQSKRGYINSRNFAELAVLLQCGLRVSELIDLKLADCDLANRQLHVHGKGDKLRTVYLSTKLARQLMIYLAKRGEQRGSFLFPTRVGTQQNRGAVHRTVRSAGARAGFKLHPHLLRHTYISTALNVKHAPMRFVQDQVGHEDVRTTMGYNHVPAGEAQRLADEFSVL